MEKHKEKKEEEEEKRKERKEKKVKKVRKVKKKKRKKEEEKSWNNPLNNIITIIVMQGASLYPKYKKYVIGAVVLSTVGAVLNRLYLMNDSGIESTTTMNKEEYKKRFVN